MNILITGARGFVGRLQYRTVRDWRGRVVRSEDFVLRISRHFDLPEEEVEDTLIHEMIHMFDFHFGPMGKQLDKYGTVAMYNFNYPFMDPRTGKCLSPGASANVMNARLMRFNSIEQLPDELLDKIKDPSKNDDWPRQYQLPGIGIRPGMDPDTGELVP